MSRVKTVLNRTQKSPHFEQDAIGYRIYYEDSRARQKETGHIFNSELCCVMCLFYKHRVLLCIWKLK